MQGEKIIRPTSGKITGKTGYVFAVTNRDITPHYGVE
jgi:hypothetical protein